MAVFCRKPGRGSGGGGSGGDDIRCAAEEIGTRLPQKAATAAATTAGGRYSHAPQQLALCPDCGGSVRGPRSSSLRGRRDQTGVVGAEEPAPEARLLGGIDEQ